MVPVVRTVTIVCNLHLRKLARLQEGTRDLLCNWHVPVWKDVRVIISVTVLCNADVVIEYDRRRSGLSSAPLDMEYPTTV